MPLKPVGGKYEGVWVNELKNGDISYYINYRDADGKPTRTLVGKKTAGSDFTVRDAYAKLIEVKYKLQHEEAPKISAGRVKKIKFDDIWLKYLEWAKNNKKSWQIDAWNYEKHIKPFLGNRAVKEIKSTDFESFKTEMASKTNAKGEKISNTTVKHQLVLARHIINYALKNDLIKDYTNPIANGRVRMPEIDNARLAFLTKEQAKELLEILWTLDRQTYHLTKVLLFTGARLGEVTSLRWQDINLHTNTIFFKKTKRGNERHIFINDSLLETLEDLRKTYKSDLIISTSTGGQLLKMPGYFDAAIESIIPGNKEKDAKQKITAHSLRHTHASWLAISGLDILQIKEQLGHKTIEMTMRYAHLIPNKRHEATKMLDV